MIDFLQKVFDNIDIENLPSFFGELILKFFGLLSDLVYSFFVNSSGLFVSLGGKFFSFFVDKFSAENPDFILFFLGAIICIFVFKRVWELISGLF